MSDDRFGIEADIEAHRRNTFAVSRSIHAPVRKLCAVSSAVTSPPSRQLGGLFGGRHFGLMGGTLTDEERLARRMKAQAARDRLAYKLKLGRESSDTLDDANPQKLVQRANSTLGLFCRKPTGPRKDR